MIMLKEMIRKSAHGSPKMAMEILRKYKNSEGGEYYDDSEGGIIKDTRSMIAKKLIESIKNEDINAVAECIDELLELRNS